MLFRSNRATATSGLYYTPDYWTGRLMASYDFNEALAVQLNVDNVMDEVYFERVRNNPTNGWATPGAGRTAVLRLTWRL